jgi:hypothetical protein
MHYMYRLPLDRHVPLSYAVYALLIYAAPY